MRNVLLILQREYIVRVRSKMFIFLTIFMPVFMAAIIVLPAKMAMKSSGERHVVVVSSSAPLADAVAKELTAQDLDSDGDEAANGSHSHQPKAVDFAVTVEAAPTEALRARLTDQLRAGSLDGFLWLGDDVVTTRKAEYYSRNRGDFIEGALVSQALRAALTRQGMTTHGMNADEIKALLGPVKLDAVHIDKQGEDKSGGVGAYLLPFFLMFAIYMTVFLYGISVMRSVIEEKSSRVVEVLLGAVTPLQLMAGKILGVGAVGLTQVGIWLGCGMLVGGGGLAAAGPVLGEMKNAHVPTLGLALMPVFFLLGYLTYACLYAAIGAMCNSDEEAQQLQFPVTLPLLLCMVVAMRLIREPDSPLTFWLSMFPLTSPLVMFVRVCLTPPPAWEIALSLGLSVVFLWGCIWLTARIYRVGILMYGKRPTLPEILKWIRYA
ncbi:MAG: ABC transporter permease [Acidobacteriota bacterium]|nr:ABC transporter permease [Acidobacteriota bacterium]